MEFLNQAIEPNATIYPDGTYDWMTVRAGGDGNTFNLKKGNLLNYLNNSRGSMKFVGAPGTADVWSEATPGVAVDVLSQQLNTPLIRVTSNDEFQRVTPANPVGVPSGFKSEFKLFSPGLAPGLLPPGYNFERKSLKVNVSGALRFSSKASGGTLIQPSLKALRITIAPRLVVDGVPSSFKEGSAIVSLWDDAQLMPDPPNADLQYRSSPFSGTFFSNANLQVGKAYSVELEMLVEGNLGGENLRYDVVEMSAECEYTEAVGPLF